MSRFQWSRGVGYVSKFVSYNFLEELDMFLGFKNLEELERSLISKCLCFNGLEELDIFLSF